MRADRFRRRDATLGDLTETIAEARSQRLAAGFFGVAGLSLVGGFVLIGMGAAEGITGAASAYLACAGLLFVATLVETSLALRPSTTSAARGRAATRVVLGTLFLALVAASLHQLLATTPSRDLAFWLGFAALYASLAALLLPWSIAQAATATAPAFIAWLPLFLFLPNSSIEGFGRLGLCAAGVVLAAIPLWIGFLNERRWEEDEERAALSREVSHTRDELGRARIVHDAMFRPPLEEGPVEVTYRYDPLREIGGDFVHILRSQRSGRVTTTVIDVSGHGLAAALTVNRLFGELERVVAEAKGEVTPAELMTQLNRYIHLTMSAHSMFATAACVQVDPVERSVRWVVAGHPPPLLRTKSGAVQRLDCTTLVLGAAPPEAFDPEEAVRHIEPGDCVIVYTDGTFEARCPSGERFGLKRLEESVAFDPPPRDFPTFLANLVARHHEGKPDDDLLVAQITFKGGARRVFAAQHDEEDVRAVG
jgi:serine phosphatase RsbU (regulator of sigma subunit)